MGVCGCVIVVACVHLRVWRVCGVACVVHECICVRVCWCVSVCWLVFVCVGAFVVRLYMCA